MKTVNESGRMTYREMAYLILEDMTDEQMDCDVTAADPLYLEKGYADNKSFVRELGSLGTIGLNLIVPDKDGIDNLGLDDDHPVFIALDE